MKNKADGAERILTGSPLALSGEQLARALGVSLRHVRRMDSAGRLPKPITLGRSVRWPLHGPGGIQAWLAAGCPDRKTWERIQGDKA